MRLVACSRRTRSAPPPNAERACPRVLTHSGGNHPQARDQGRAAPAIVSPLEGSRRHPGHRLAPRGLSRAAGYRLPLTRFEPADGEGIPNRVRAGCVAIVSPLGFETAPGEIVLLPLRGGFETAPAAIGSPPWFRARHICDCPQNSARERLEFKHINRGSIRNQMRFR
jgi:hypothetical protein